MYINCELYFARAFKNWDNGGVAFIRTTFNPTVSTMGRIYRITKGQLIDIAKQETNTGSGLELDLIRLYRTVLIYLKKSLGMVICYI